MKKIYLIIVCILILTITSPSQVFAHGLKITHEEKKSIEITARFDNGEPMSEAQVAIFAPGNPSAPWATGQCDKEGRYVFTPDSSKPGTWDIQVRQAGHGEMIHINVGGDVAAAESGYTKSQIILMSVSIIWGLVGTALFFRRRRN